MRSFDTTNQALNVAIKVQTCRQFVDFIDPGPSLYFIHQKEQKRKKNSSHFRFRFGKQVAEFTAQEFPELFCCLQKFAKYYIWISRLFHLLTFAFYKMDEYFWTTDKDKILRECLPWALSLKRQVVVLKATAKKCIKHHETCNHDYIVWPAKKWLHIPTVKWGVWKWKEKTASFLSSAFVLDTTGKQVILTSL